MKARLLRAYFTDGVSIGDPESLVTAVAKTGLDPEEARAVLTGDAYADAVRADQRRAAAFGIGGVPFFVIDERHGVSGAQPSDLFLNALEQAWAESHPLAMVGATSSDAACDDDGCALPPAD